MQLVPWLSGWLMAERHRRTFVTSPGTYNVIVLLVLDQSNQHLHAF